MSFSSRLKSDRVNVNEIKAEEQNESKESSKAQNETNHDKEQDEYPSIIIFCLSSMRAVWDIPKGLEFLGISDEDEVQFLNFGTDDDRSASVDTVKWMAPCNQEIESQKVIQTSSSFRLHSDDEYSSVDTV